MIARRGLSLIELLVALASVAILAGVLVPALGSATRAGRHTKTLANLRQLGLAATMYADDHRFFPPALRYETAPFTIIAWDYVHVPATGATRSGALWSYADLPPGEVLDDPEYDGELTPPGERYTGYNYNTTHIGGEAPFGGGWDVFRAGVRRSACRRTATIALFGQGGWAGGTNKFMRAPLNTVEGDLGIVYAGGQAFRSNGRSGVVYLDGHCESVGAPFAGPHATEGLLEETMGFPANGFLSGDDAAYDPNPGL